MHQFTIKNLRAFFRRLDRLANYFSHSSLRRELNSSAKEIYQMIDATFERGGPRGQKWKKHSPNTGIQRTFEIGYYDKPHNTGILEWTGRLRRSLTGRGPLATKIIRYGCLELLIGSKHPLALTHHKGSIHRRGVVSALNAATLRFFSGDTTPIFSTPVAGAVMRIPARPFWSRDDENYIMIKLRSRVAKKAFSVWIGGHI